LAIKERKVTSRKKKDEDNQKTIWYKYIRLGYIRAKYPKLKKKPIFKKKSLMTM